MSECNSLLKPLAGSVNRVQGTSISSGSSFTTRVSVDTAISSSSRIAIPLHLDAPPSRTSDAAVFAAYQRWKTANEASGALPDMKRAVAQCKTEADSAKARLEGMKTQSTGLQRKPSIMRKIVGKAKKDQSTGGTELLSTGITEARCSKEDAERRLATLSDQLRAFETVAGMLDGYYDTLKSMMVSKHLLAWRYSLASEAAISRAEKVVAEVEGAYTDSQRMTNILQRVELAIQSTHHHYRNAMNDLDAVCGARRSKWESLLADEQSKEMTYKAAAVWAQKAQKCFDEFLRVFDAHRDLLGNEPQERHELKQVGLLQAVQIYKLNYGGKPLQMGIIKEMEVMLQKQEAVFQRLTALAVWVQDFTKHSETVCQDVRVKRDRARHKLVVLWMDDSMPRM
ncbi:hypothetical protein BKA93DRAFT_825454 [Sparassis latifolia]